MMDWESPSLLLLTVPALVLLLWFDARSTHPMSGARRRSLLVVRTLMVALALAALAGPARVVRSTAQAVVFVLDHSLSQGAGGLARVHAVAERLAGALPDDVPVGIVAAGAEPTLLAQPGDPFAFEEPRFDLMEAAGAQTDFAGAVALAEGLFPAGAARHVVVVGDGLETRGRLEDTAREAAVAGLRIHAVPVAGDPRPDVRVARVTPSQTRITEGAAVEIEATLESSLDGEGLVKLFENGLEVERRPVTVSVGSTLVETFQRTPARRNIYNYRVVLEGFEGDAIRANNEALTLVDVRGKPLLLFVEGEAEEEARFLRDAMAVEGIRLDYRPPGGMPRTLRELAGYDGVILSDVAAHKLGEDVMVALRDYVDELGGGLVMIGGMNSFGVGGYYRTPIEEVLPVKLTAPDQEEFQSSALALVLDRSGSMSGQKIEVCKSAAIATSEILNRKDYIGVYAFDSNVHVIVPMTRVTSTSAIAGQIATLSPGGGTNIMPGMTQARLDLGKVKAKIKHMIVLTDGQTAGTGYEAVAAQCRAEGITISTVAIGNGAQVGLLQRIASSGGGQAYSTMDPSAITRIFTQDTMTHTGRMIREEPFEPRQVESHPMLGSWAELEPPPLLGYVKTNRKATAQVPLVTDAGDPLLAHWRFGLGKVTAFTSDAKSRWAALWVAGWPGYGQFWAQLLRETARAPQGVNMDLRLEETGDEVRLHADLLEDAGTYRNDADIVADLFFLPANALGSSMKSVGERRLTQEGPGRYTGSFRPDDPGVYLVRARSGARMVSAGFVHNPSSEAATGQIDQPLLERVASLSGGQFLADTTTPLTLGGSEVAHYVELRPHLLGLLLALFLADLLIRRWENVRGLVQWTGLAKAA